MWIDDVGGVHTVALPNPTEVMSEEFQVALDALARSNPDALQLVLERAEEEVFDAGLSGLSGSEDYVAATPPVALLRGNLASVDDVAAAIQQADLRWRLDLILALVDYLD